MYEEKDISKLLDSLAKSKFRSSFHLNGKMKAYTRDKGYEKIESDAYDFIKKRIADAEPKNDGKQTPMRANSHPVFIAQHATGLCCRGCALRIHGIEKGKELNDRQIDYCVKVIMTWIKREMEDDNA